jgi:rhodanese-related sulfurtransferase
MSNFKDVSASALPALLATGKVNLVDVRSDAETATGIIQGAIKLPLHLLPMRIQELDASIPTIFYCHLGGRSAQAAAFAVNQGLTSVYNLSGGITAWAQQGGGVVRG